MAHLIPLTKQPRRGTLYTKPELLVISKYKTEYKEQTTRALRANVLRNKILVDLFNYWLEQKTLPLEGEESINRVKELVAWVRNNWRPNATAVQSNPIIKIRAVDYVWEAYRDEVEEELKMLLGVEELDNKDPRYFQQRNAAAKLAIQNLSVEDRALLELGLEKRRAEGNPESVQRYRAVKYRRKALQGFSKERWLDMGMSTITFTVHVDEQGRYIGDMHEDVFDNLGIAGRNFAEQNGAVVIEMMRKFLDYVKSARLEAADPQIANQRQAEPEPIEIRMTNDGFPIIPKVVMEKDLKKSEWEALLRGFLTQHYFLASGEKSRKVPYTAIMKDTQHFIKDDYRPTGVRFQDPRNMALNDIREALQHCYQRQAESGPRSSFRFSQFVGPQRKHLFSIYPDPSNPNLSNPNKHPRKKKDKGKQREDALDGLFRIDESVEPLTADHTQPRTEPQTNPLLGGRTKEHDQRPTEPEESPEHDLVRIDMRQMLQLKDMGYEALGPVNGPNEGYPEYEIPKGMYQDLQSRLQTTPAPTQTQFARFGSEPAPNVIDPALLGQAEPPLTSRSLWNVDMAPEVPPSSAPNGGQTNDDSDLHPGSSVHPTTPPNEDAGSAHNPNHNKTPPRQLRKRGQGDLSPQTNRQKRGKSKKKKLTDDARAAMEAQNMVQSGSRRRKPTRRQ